MFRIRTFPDHARNENVEEVNRWEGDRCRNQGTDISYVSVQRVVDYQQSLSGPYREDFAQAIRQNSEKLIS